MTQDIKQGKLSKEVRTSTSNKLATKGEENTEESRNG